MLFIGLIGKKAINDVIHRFVLSYLSYDSLDGENPA